MDDVHPCYRTSHRPYKAFTKCIHLRPDRKPERFADLAMGGLSHARDAFFIGEAIAGAVQPHQMESSSRERIAFEREMVNAHADFSIGIRMKS